MRLSSRYIRETALLTAVLLIALMLCSLALLSYHMTYRSLLSGALSDNRAQAFAPIQNKYSLMALPEKASVKHEIKLVQTEKKLCQSYYRTIVSLSAKHSAFVPSTMTISGFLTFTGNINNHTSEISLRVGGHAPPFPSRH